MVLVFVADGLGHVDEARRDLLAHGGAHGAHQIEPASRLAGADVQQRWGAGGLVEQIEQDGHHILDKDEIAQLFAIGVIGAVAAEELHRLAAREGFEHLVDDAAHRALMLLIGAIDIEEFQAAAEGGERLAGLTAGGHRLVEEVL